MYIISSIPNYIFTSCASIETYYLTDKIFENIKKTYVRNNLFKNGLLVVVKSVLIIGTAALTTQYPIAVTISLLAIHLLSSKNKTDSPGRIEFDKSTQTAHPPKMVESETQTAHPPKMVESETQIAIEVESKEISARDIDISLFYFENELSNLSKMDEFDLLSSDIVDKIKDLSNEIASLKESEELDHCAMENRLFPKIKTLFKSQIIKNFYEHIGNFGKNIENLSEEESNNLKEVITLNLRIVKFVTNFMEFQKKGYFINKFFNKTYFDDLLNSMKQILTKLDDGSNLLRIGTEISILETKILKAKLNLAYIKNEETTTQKYEQTTTQKVDKLPNFLEAFKYSNTSRILTRKDIANEILLQLNKRELKHTILIGEAGSGKTTILENVVDKISKKPKFKNFSFFKLNATAFSAGTYLVGEQEQRIQEMKQIFKGLQENNPDIQIVLVIDEIHRLTGMGTSSNSNNDVWQSLKEDLGNSKFTIIGTTTEEEYKTHIKKDSAVASRFSTITVPKLTPNEYEQILMAKAEDCIKQYDLSISPEDLIVKVQEKQKTISPENTRNVRQFIHCIQATCSELELRKNQEWFD